jgi:hypothetical protein
MQWDLATTWILLNPVVLHTAASQCDKAAVSRCQPHLRVTSKILTKEQMKYISDLCIGKERSRWEARRTAKDPN